MGLCGWCSGPGIAGKCSGWRWERISVRTGSNVITISICWWNFNGTIVSRPNWMFFYFCEDTRCDDSLLTWFKLRLNWNCNEEEPEKGKKAKRKLEFGRGKGMAQKKTVRGNHSLTDWFKTNWEDDENILQLRWTKKWSCGGIQREKCIFPIQLVWNWNRWWCGGFLHCIFRTAILLFLSLFASMIIIWYNYTSLGAKCITWYVMDALLLQL